MPRTPTLPFTDLLADLEKTEARVTELKTQLHEASREATQLRAAVKRRRASELKNAQKRIAEARAVIDQIKQL